MAPFQQKFGLNNAFFSTLIKEFCHHFLMNHGGQESSKLESSANPPLTRNSRSRDNMFIDDNERGCELTRQQQQ